MTTTIEEIKKFMVNGTDINEQIKESNIKSSKRLDFELKIRNVKPIEVKLLQTNDSTLSTAEFLILAGKELKLDFVDLIFAKYNIINSNEFLSQINLTTFKTLAEEIKDMSNFTIYNLDETSSCKSYFLENKINKFVVIENWHI